MGGYGLLVVGELSVYPEQIRVVREGESNTKKELDNTLILSSAYDNFLID